MILKILIMFVKLQNVGVYFIGIFDYELNYIIVYIILRFNDFNIIIFLVIDHILALRCIGLSLVHWNAILKHLHAGAWSGIIHMITSLNALTRCLMNLIYKIKQPLLLQTMLQILWKLLGMYLYCYFSSLFAFQIKYQYNTYRL